MSKKYQAECEIQGTKIEVETGRLAKQADASVLVKSGDNRVLVSVVSSKKPSDMDFFPLTVEYQEKFYSVGRIPGGFFKREGRPPSEAILKARLIDRPLRPCFPENYRHDTQIVAQVLSFDGEFPVEILAGIGASTAIHISDIPFSGPVGFLKVSLQEGNWLFNTSEEISHDLDMIVAGTKKGLLMVEGEAQFVSESQSLEALKKAHEAMQGILDMQEELRKKVGSKEKRQVKVEEKDEAFLKSVEEFVSPLIDKAMSEKEKTKRYEAYDKLKEEAKEKFNQEEVNQETKRLQL